MANYHTEFCVSIKDVTDEEFAWLQENFNYEPPEEAEESDILPWYDIDGLTIPFEYLSHLKDRVAYIQSDGEGSVSHVCEFLCAFLAKFRPTQYMTLAWADTCDKNRPDAFGGGAAFITAEGIEYFDSSSWLAEQARKFTPTTLEHPVYVYRFELVSKKPISEETRKILAITYDSYTPGKTRVISCEGESIDDAEPYGVRHWH